MRKVYLLKKTQYFPHHKSSGKFVKWGKTFWIEANFPFLFYFFVFSLHFMAFYGILAKQKYPNAHWRKFNSETSCFPRKTTNSYERKSNYIVVYIALQSQVLIFYIIYYECRISYCRGRQRTISSSNFIRNICFPLVLSHDFFPFFLMDFHFFPALLSPIWFNILNVFFFQFNFHSQFIIFDVCFYIAFVRSSMLFISFFA